MVFWLSIKQYNYEILLLKHKGLDIWNCGVMFNYCLEEYGHYFNTMIGACTIKEVIL